MSKRFKAALSLSLSLLLSGACFAAEPLSEKALDQITAQGQESGVREDSASQSISRFSAHESSHTGLIIQSYSQTHLIGGAVNNAAGRNQIANGLKIR